MQILHLLVLFGVSLFRMSWCDLNGKTNFKPVLLPTYSNIDVIFHFYKGCEIITKDNLIYILSKRPVTYQEAAETCQSYGGRLAQISNQEKRQFLEPHLRSFYIPGCYARLLIIIFISRSNFLPESREKQRNCLV